MKTTALIALLVILSSLFLTMCSNSNLTAAKPLQKVEVSVIPNTKKNGDRYELKIVNRSSTSLRVKADIELKKPNSKGKMVKTIESVSQAIYPHGVDSVTFASKEEGFEFSRIVYMQAGERATVEKGAPSPVER